MLISTAYAQDAASGGSGALVQLLPLVLIFVVFYFLLIRPQRKEQKRHKEMIAAVAKGDEIVTSGGIIGTVIRADEDRLIIKTAGETKITVERSRVAHKFSAGEKGTAGSPDAGRK